MRHRSGGPWPLGPALGAMPQSLALRQTSSWQTLPRVAVFQSHLAATSNTGSSLRSNPWLSVPFTFGFATYRMPSVDHESRLLVRNKIGASTGGSMAKVLRLLNSLST